MPAAIPVRGRLRAHGIAVLAAVLALPLSLQAVSWWPPSPYPLFFAAVLVASLYGGVGPGMVATAFSTLALQRFFIDPDGALVLRPATLVVLVVFSLTALVVGRLSAALRRADEERRESEGRFRTIADSAPVMIWMADEEDRGTWFNRPWLDFTGRPLDSELGHGWAEAIHPDDRADLVAACRPADDDRRPFTMEFRLRRRDGEYRWVLGNAVPRSDADGRFAGYIGSCIDISDRKQAEQELRARDERLRRFTESDVIGIITSDTVGQILHANDAFLRTVGYTREDLAAGRVRWLDMTPPEHLHLDERGIAEARERGSCTPYEKEYIRKDGSRVPILIGYILLGEARDEAIAFVLDLSERKRIEREARDARDAAEAANRAKDAFLAALSHELRTPLTPVLMAVADLESDPRLPEDLRAEAAMARRNVEMEARLIDDLLDLTRVTQGKLGLHHAPVDVHVKIRNAVEVCSADLRAKGIRLALDLRATRPRVAGDAARLQQVLWNVLKNAVKFTPEGGRVAVATRDDPGGRLVVEVTDTGVGIPPDTLPRIFDAFEQGGRGVTQRFGGLGLGLAISRALVEAHGGTIAASSEGQGRGATFTIALPGAAPAVEADPSAPPPAARRGHRPLRILLVEDCPDTSRVAARLLSREGHDVTTAASVATALAAASSGPFDLLISDMGLPDGSGLDLIRRLAPLPGIALSGYGMQADVLRSREAGFAEHLTKPIDFDVLEEAILRVAGTHVREFAEGSGVRHRAPAPCEDVPPPTMLPQ